VKRSFAERGIDEQTLEIRAVEVTTSTIGDAPMLSHLLQQIPADQEISTVTADGAYDTRKCHDAIHCPAVHVYMHERGRSRCKCRHPATQECQALAANLGWCNSSERSCAGQQIPRTGAMATMERISPQEPRRNQPSRDHALHNPAGQWMHCVKLLGQSLMARDFDRQVAEIHIRAAVLNGYNTLGIPVTEIIE